MSLFAIYSTISIIGICGLMIACTILFYDMGHTKFSILVVLIASLLFFVSMYRYYIKCYDIPSPKTSRELKWNVHSIYNPAWTLVVATLLCFTVLIMCVMYHFDHSISELITVLDGEYIFYITFAIIMYFFVTIGTLGLASTHKGKLVEYTSKELNRTSSISSPPPPPPNNPEYYPIVETTWKPASN